MHTPWRCARKKVNNTDGDLNNEDGSCFFGNGDWLMVSVMAVECRDHGATTLVMVNGAERRT